MLTEDQSLFEASNLDNRHSELLISGALLSQRLKDFEEMGQPCFDSVPADQIVKILDAVKEYESLLLPPKACIGCLSCNKPRRTGIEYERRLLTVHAKVVGAIFMLRIAIIGYNCDIINEEGKKYSNYGIKMNTLANTLEAINVKTNDRAKEELKEVLELVEEFVNDFIATEMKDSFNEAMKRIRKTKELLNPDNGKVISKKILVSAQVNMQEIMNSAASVSAAKSKEKMDQLDVEVLALKEASTQLLNAYRNLEEPVLAAQMSDVLEQYKEQTEDLEKTLDNKLKTMKKLWKTVRGQSTYRPVAVLDDSFDDFKASNAVASVAGVGMGAVGAGVGVMGAGVNAAAYGVGVAAAGAGNLVGKVGQIAVNIPNKTISMASHVPTKVITTATALPKIFGKEG